MLAFFSSETGQSPEYAQDSRHVHFRLKDLTQHVTQPSLVSLLEGPTLMYSREYYALRSRTANLTKYRKSDDPELLAARKELQELTLVEAVNRAVANTPSPISETTRQKVIGLLSAA